MNSIHIYDPHRMKKMPLLLPASEGQIVPLQRRYVKSLGGKLLQLYLSLHLKERLLAFLNHCLYSSQRQRNAQLLSFVVFVILHGISARWLFLICTHANTDLKVINKEINEPFSFFSYKHEKFQRSHQGRRRRRSFFLPAFISLLFIKDN